MVNAEIFRHHSKGTEAQMFAHEPLPNTLITTSAHVCSLHMGLRELPVPAQVSFQVELLRTPQLFFVGLLLRRRGLPRPLLRPASHPRRCCGSPLALAASFLAGLAPKRCMS